MRTEFKIWLTAEAAAHMRETSVLPVVQVVGNQRITTITDPNFFREHCASTRWDDSNRDYETGKISAISITVKRIESDDFLDFSSLSAFFIVGDSTLPIPIKHEPDTENTGSDDEWSWITLQINYVASLWLLEINTVKCYSIEGRRLNSARDVGQK